MNLTAVSSAGFKGGLPKLAEGQVWSRDYSCPEGGMFPVKLERSPKKDTFEITFKIPQGYIEQPCPNGYHVDYTPDNRQVFIPDFKG